MFSPRVSCRQFFQCLMLVGFILTVCLPILRAQLLPPAPDPIVFSPGRNISNTGGARLGQVAVDSAGNNISVVWWDRSAGYDAVFFTHSQNGGLTFASPQNLSNDPGGSTAPQMAVDSAGNINITWSAFSGDRSGFFSHSIDGGATFSTPVSIANGVASSPKIALDSHGNIYLAWADTSPSHNIFFSQSRDGGMTFTTPVQVAIRIPAGSAGITGIAVDSGGNINVAWEDFFSYARVWLSRSNDAGSTFAPPVSISGVLEFWSEVGMAIDSKDFIYIVYNTVPNGNVWLRYSNDGGATFSATNVTNNNTRPYVSPSRAQVAVDSSGKVGVVWDSSNIFFSRSSDGGASFSSLNVSKNDLTTSSMGAEMTLDTQGNIHLVWTTWTNSTRDVYFSRSTDAGATFSSPQKLSNDASNSAPMIALDSSGGINVIWLKSSSGISDLFYSRGINLTSPLPKLGP